jgi:hypothetical protein
MDLRDSGGHFKRWRRHDRADAIRRADVTVEVEEERGRGFGVAVELGRVVGENIALLFYCVMRLLRLAEGLVTTLS